MNDAESRLFRARRRKVIGSFRKRVGRRVVFQLEISGKFSEIAEISSANSDKKSLEKFAKKNFFLKKIFIGKQENVFFRS